MQRALILLLPGLGDALTAGPILRRLVTGGFAIDALTMLFPVAEYVRALEMFNDVIELPLLTNAPKSAFPLLRLRRRHYDVAVIPFPATRWQYAAVARMVSAKLLAAHAYGGLADVIVRSNRRSRLEPLRGGHRAAENDRLAGALHLPGGGDLRYLVPPAWRAETVPGLLGLHTGSMVYKGNEARRWPFDRFVELIRRLLPSRRVRVFIGPHERDDMRGLREVFADAIEFVDAPLASAARALSECEVFVANDAGLAHLAAGLGVKTITLFGMTDPVRATPIGPAVALRPSACPPCHDEGMRDFRCVLNIGYRCMARDFPVDVVLSAVDHMFQNRISGLQPVERSKFRLYGRQIVPDPSIR